jgi:hypothetical protein
MNSQRASCGDGKVLSPIAVGHNMELEKKM